MTDLFPYIVGAFGILAQAGMLWNIIRQNNAARAAQITNEIEGLRKECQSADTQLQTILSAIKSSADLGISQLQREFHEFQLDVVRGFASRESVTQMEERVGKQFAQLFEELTGIRHRVDTLLDRTSVVKP